MSETKTIHVRVWSGSRSAVVTEMANAGKRGKTCRTVRLSGEHASRESAPGSGEVRWFWQETLPKLTGEESFDDVMILVRALKALAPDLGAVEETIRGVDAPVPPLSAGVAGEFHASANEDGVTVADLTDRFNDPRSINREKNSAAYAKASRAWAAVRAAASYSEACAALRAAGVDLHSYCAVD